MSRPGRRLLAPVLAVIAAGAQTLGAAPRSTPQPAATPAAVTATPLARTFFPEPLLALAFVSDTRLLALTASSLALVRTDAFDMPVLARLTLEPPTRPVRAPAGLLIAIGDSDAAWVLTNRSARAWLVAFGDDRLTLRGDAEAAPVAGSATGLRYREGTNWIEGVVPRLGNGPFLALELSDKAWAVTTGARLVWPNAMNPRGNDGHPAVGPTLAALWPGWLATSTSRAPGAGDALLVFTRRKGLAYEVATLPMEESIRATASRRSATHVRLAVATETASGTTRLVLLELRRNES